MRFKKVYLEITNRCNLNCDFCIKNNRQYNDITKEEYKIIINKIKDYTESLYLHVLGEPLIHKDINYFIDYATKEGLNVNITTNGYLINHIKNNHNIHKLNISLHSFNNQYNLTLKEYLDNIFDVIDNIKDKTFITLRLWVSNKNTDYILSYICNKYKLDKINLIDNTKIKITKNLIIDTFHTFTWPDLNNSYYSKIGKCYGLIDQIGILSNGTIIPCCLDSKGNINLGNIYKDELINIINSDRVVKMIDGFKHGIKCEKLCRHCHFLNK